MLDSSSCDAFFRSINTKFYKNLFGFFITKGPHFFSVIANTKEGGGLLVVTTESYERSFFITDKSTDTSTMYNSSLFFKNKPLILLKMKYL